MESQKLTMKANLQGWCPQEISCGRFYEAFFFNSLFRSLNAKGFYTLGNADDILPSSYRPMSSIYKNNSCYLAITFVRNNNLDIRDLMKKL